jgi:hypothetical protein
MERFKQWVKDVTCATIGHSRIKTTCFGYWSCARCREQVGDSLGGAYGGEDDVIVGHDCPTCRANAAKLTWKDRLFAPDPKVGA